MRLTEFHELVEGQFGPVRGASLLVDHVLTRLRRAHRRAGHRGRRRSARRVAGAVRRLRRPARPVVSGFRPLASLTRSSVACRRSGQRVASPASVRVPHTQSQCAATVSPGTGAGASDAPSLRHRTRSARASPSPQRAVANVSGARHDRRMLVLDGLDGAPADPAVLHAPAPAWPGRGPGIAPTDRRRTRESCGAPTPSVGRRCASSMPVTWPVNAARSRASSAAGSTLSSSGPPTQ